MENPRRQNHGDGTGSARGPLLPVALSHTVGTAADTTSIAINEVADS